MREKGLQKEALLVHCYEGQEHLYEGLLMYIESVGHGKSEFSSMNQGSFALKSAYQWASKLGEMTICSCIVKCLSLYNPNIL